MKDFDIIIVPHGGGKTRTFRIKGYFVYALFALIFSIILSITILGIFYGPVYKKAMRASKLERENERLQRENEKIKLLEKRLTELEALRKQLAQMLGVNQTPPPPEIFAMYGKKKKAETKPSILDTIMEPSSPEIGGLIEKTLKEEKYIPSLAPVRGYISRGFSPPKHLGIDIVAPLGTPVVATADGIVVEAGYDEFWGYRVVVDHNGEYRSVYAHLDKFTVRPGGRVKRGEVIGFLGSSGRSTGPHLHFEIWRGNTPLNPLLFVSK